MLELKGVSVIYPDGNLALNGVGFALGRGERAALVGANGAGKSTLLRAIVGLLPVSGGEISVDGIVLSRNTVPEIRARVGIVFQNPDDQLFMTKVSEDVAFGPRNMGLPEEEVSCRVDTSLGRLDASHLRDRISDRLSGGEKRLVGLASVLSMAPSTLLLDEPSSSLDPRSRRNLIRLLSSLSQTILVATHDLDLARRLCSRAVVLRDGEVCAEGSAVEILTDEERLEMYGL
ncbi:MAG: energy-coupling factor ABC transporter ATP-binding protein [Synergistaceae bacterium]|jgi:cobalt/nickel transport system ATP-binding protein|nr:energy-coupling factor ABC transporter ATP-binding protein [Synergistaceae bacterium]